MKRNKTIRKYIAWIALVAVVAALAAMPLLAKNDDNQETYQASILSGTAQAAQVSKTLTGGGTLTEEEAQALELPSGVLLTEFLVENGNYVNQGDPLASIDRVSVMQTIASVQETLEYLAEELEDASETKIDSAITAEAGGLVKAIYAQAGDDVQSVMLEHGALAVLSLDSLMAVQINRYTDLIVGDTVLVTLADDTEVSGRVESNLNGVLTVTIEDKGYAVGDKVKVTTEDDDRIGSGELYIHSPWNVTGISGTVSAVKITEGKTVAAGKTIFTLTDTEYTATFELLSQQRREYEDLMLELFQLYQMEVLTAPCSGVVSGIDEDSAYLLSDKGAGWTLTLLANAPNGDDETVYHNYLGKVAAVGMNGWALSMNPTDLPITDYKDTAALVIDEAAMTQVAIHTPQVPIYELVEGQWVQLEAQNITAGDILLFAGDDMGNFVWIVRIQKAQDQTATQQPGQDQSGSQEQGSGQTQQPSIQTPSYSGSFGGGSMGSAQQEEEFELHSLEKNTVLSVTPQDTMTMTITVDELDLSMVQPGMGAAVTVDALPGVEIAAEVTGIGSSGENSGGSSKFTVELTVPRQEDMLSGMNASAVLTVATQEAAVTIPAAALVERGSQTVVYTGYDEKTKELVNPVVVTTGASDGENVQILSGLEAGDTFYYAYYDTLVISDVPDTPGFSFNFGR